MKTLFYRCPICGNIILKEIDSGVVPSCCGRSMELLTPQGYDPASQLVMHHLPSIVTLDNNAYRVAIGAEPHPMLPTHYVNFIYLEGEQSASIRFLKPEDKPSTVFCLPRDHPVAAYAYCNIHGLWRSDNLKPS